MTPLLDGIGERDFTNLVVDFAQLRGWLVAHFRPAQTQSGRWVTAMKGDTGFPDLTLARDHRVVFAELKTEKGRVSVNQTAWLNAIGPTAHIWRPSDWPKIEETLR